MVFPFRRAACLLLLPLAALAQPQDDSLALIAPSNSVPGTVEIYFFPVLATGDFGDTEGGNSAFATVGMGLGLDYTYPIGKSPLGWVTGAAFTMNPIDSRKVAKAVAGSDALPVDDPKVEGGTFFNIPLLTGLRFEGRPAPQLALNAQVQAGITIINQAEYKFSGEDFDGRDFWATLTPETATAPGFMIGAGLDLFDRLNLGVRYYGTAKADMKSKFKNIDGVSADEEGKLAITFVAFVLGVRF